MKLAGVLLMCVVPAAFGQYAAHRDGEVVRLEDGKTQTIVSVIPSRGNASIEMKVKGKNVIRFPFASMEAYLKGGGRGQGGAPFLAPWANRLDEMAFYANGKKYTFNPDLGTVRAGRNNIPIHGFLSNASWQVLEAKADQNSAWLTSRLEVYKNPDWMAQFPFAHTIEITYRVKAGALEVTTKIENLSSQPMPVSIGFHPYFQVNDGPRDEWTFGIAAKTYWVLSKDLVPTGETKPIEQFLPKPEGSTLKGLALDDVFTDLVRDASGNATMWVKGKNERVDVVFGPKFKSVVVYSPGGPDRDFICFEPMAGPTNAMNMAQKGLYKELQSIPPGQTWQETYWVKPSGF